MFKVKPVIQIAAVIFLVTLNSSFSQEKEISCSSEFTLNVTEKDPNPQTGIFKLYNSSRTQFDNTVLIKFELGEGAYVTLTVCDLNGKIIETLADDLMDAGVYIVLYKSSDKIIPGELTYKLEVKGVSGIRNMFAVK